MVVFLLEKLVGWLVAFDPPPAAIALDNVV
jgi:hypothetical protein